MLCGEDSWIFTFGLKDIEDIEKAASEKSERDGSERKVLVNPLPGLIQLQRAENFPGLNGRIH
jgi:hypothetical protein